MAISIVERRPVIKSVTANAPRILYEDFCSDTPLHIAVNNVPLKAAAKDVEQIKRAAYVCLHRSFAEKNTHLPFSETFVMFVISTPER